MDKDDIADIFSNGFLAGGVFVIVVLLIALIV
jgi:hypothetical protein